MTLTRICDSYIGAAPLVNNSDILTAAASIVTVEARHQTFIRIASAAQPVPAAFDTPLGVRGVFTLAAAFIQSCPSGSALNITPFPALQVNNNVNITGGTTLTLQDQSQAQSLGSSVFCAFTGPNGTEFAPLSQGQCTVPNDLTGEIYVSLSKNGMSLSDDQVLAGLVLHFVPVRVVENC
jgi:Ferritin-like domain